MLAKIFIAMVVIAIIVMGVIVAKNQQSLAERETSGEPWFYGKDSGKPFICSIMGEPDHFRCDLPRFALEVGIPVFILLLPLIPFFFVFGITWMIIKLINFIQNEHTRNRRAT